MNQELQLAKYYQAAQKYDDYALADDFERYSTETSAMGQGWYNLVMGRDVLPSDREFLTGGNIISQYDDIVNKYGENSEAAKDFLRGQLAYDDGKVYAHPSLYYMSEQERKIYAYIYNKEGQAAAEEYLTFIGSNLEQRRATADFERRERAYDDLPQVAKKVFEAADAGLEVVRAYPRGIKNAVKGVVDYFGNEAREYGYDDYERQLIAKKYDGTSVGTAIDVSESVGQMTPVIASNFIPYVGEYVSNAILYTSAAGNAKQEMLRNGYTATTAAAYGNAIGLSELLTEKVLGGVPGVSKGNVGKIGNKIFGKVLAKLPNGVQTLVRAGIDLAGNAIGESVEERVQSGLVEPFLGNALLGEDNSYNLFSEEADEAAKIGFWSGLVMNVANIGGVIGKADAETKANNLLVDTAKFDSTAVKKARTELADALAKGEVTQEGVNKVVTAVIDEISGIVNNEINEFVSGEGIYSTEGGNFKADNNPFAAVRDSFSEEGRAAFDIAMKNAVDPEATARQFEINYLRGYKGKTFELGYGSELTPSMQKEAYKYGAEAAKAEAEKLVKSVNMSVERGKVKIADGVKISRSGLRRMNTVAKDTNTGITVGGKAPLDENGNQIRGWYYTDDGRIHIYADAEVTVYTDKGVRTFKGEEAAMMVVFGHELTHRLKTLNGDSYGRFEKFVLSKVGKAEVQRRMQKHDWSETKAKEEITCDFAMQYLFADKKTIREITRTDSKFAQKIREIIEWIKSKLGLDGIKKLTAEEYRMKLMLDEAARLWNDAYRASVSNVKNDVETKNTTDGGVKYSKESAVTKITSGMSDTDRTAVLKNKSIAAPIYNGEADAAVEAKREDLQKKYGSFAEDAMRRVAAEFEMFESGTEKYRISDLDIEVAFSKGSLDESTHKKVTDVTQLAKLLPKLRDAVENAVGVEAHNNRYFADFNTKEFYELVGGYFDGDYFVPIRFGVKAFADKTYSLYIVVCQDRIEKTKVMKPSDAHKAMKNGSRLVTISIPHLFENVNTPDLLRYIPDDFLNEMQKESKYKAIADTIRYTNDKNDSAYKKAIERGDRITAQRIVEAAAKAWGAYSVRGNPKAYYHGTKSEFTVFDKSKLKDSLGFFFTENIDEAKEYGIPNRFFLKSGKAIDLFGDDFSKYNKKRGEELSEALTADGYDSIYSYSHGVEWLIVFNPMQIKSAETITYDDNGKVIPISQRFNAENPDIRYSTSGDEMNLFASIHEQREVWKRVQKMTPMQIANMQLEDIDPLPKRTPKAPSGINAENGKESKFYGSAMDSENVAEDTKRLIKTVDDIRYYAGVSNEETLNEANDRLNLMGQAENNRFFALNVEHATAVDVAEGFILLKRYQDKGDFESACGVARKLREIGTSAGQTVQTFSILGRLTPEGMAVYAQKELDAVREEMIRKHSEVWVEQRKDMFSLSAEEMQFIKDNMIAASKLPDGREKNILIAKIASMLEEKLPKKVLRQIQAYTRVSMLLNSKTMLRNVLGNAIMMPMYVVEDFVGAGFDKALATKSGVRTKGVMHFDKKTGKAVVKGVYESYDDFRKHVNTRDIQNDRFELGGGDAFRHYSLQDFKDAKGIKRVKWVGYGVSDMLNAVDRISSFLLDLGDRPFFEFHFTNSINNQLRLNHATEPTADMIRIATTEALQRTWQDDNAYTKAASQIRNMLNGGKSWGIGSIIVPFTKTPTNLTKALIEYSPVGLVKAITYNAHKYSNSLKNAHPDPTVQKAFVDSFAKGVTGTLVMAIAYALANAGLISGGDDDKDKDLAAFEKNVMGIAPYSVTVNGKSYSYDWAQPVGGLFAITTDYVQNVKAGNSPKVKGLDTLGTYGKAILNALSAGGNVLFEQSFLQGVSELFGDDGLMGGLISSVANAPTQAIPTALSQIAQLADPYVRTSYVYRDTLSTAANKVNAKLPWERKELAPVVDVLGHDVLAYGGNNSFANVFLNPSNIYSETATDAAKEIYRVYEETGDATVIPRVAPYYFEYDDKRYTFTPHERADYQRATGSANERIVNDLKNTYGYMKLSDEDKAKALALVTDYATANTKYEYLAEHDVKYERDSWMIKAAEGVDNGVTEAEYIVAKTVTKGIVKGLPDNDGETYDNSRSLLIMEAIYSIPNLNDEKRKYLFESFGVGSGVIGYTREGVQNTLSQMRAKTYVPPYKVITIKVPNK